MSKPFVPRGVVQRTAPPAVTFQFVIAQCPVCSRIAFGIVEVTAPALVGQKVRTRLAGVECPWCLHLTEYDPSGKATVKAFPLNLAAQVRQAVTTPETMAAPVDAIDGNPLETESVDATVHSPE